MQEWIDITMPLSEATAPWPGDDPFARRVESSDGVQVTSASLSLHVGTHADAPLHTLAGAAPISGMAPGTFIGSAVVWDASGAGALIGPADLARCEAQCGIAPRVLLRTRRGEAPRRFPSEWKAMSPAAAEWLAARGVVLVGMDTPSPDPRESEQLPVHRVLARRGMALVENLVLWHVKSGRYELFAQPLAIDGAEASPVRALLRKQP